MQKGAFSTITESASVTGERVLVDAEGNRLIAASRRPDGSLRKEIKIRPGYFREEEKQRFVTRGTEFRQRVEEINQIPIGFLPVNPLKSRGTADTKKKPKKKSQVSIEDLPLPEVEIFATSNSSLAVLEQDVSKTMDFLTSSSSEPLNKYVASTVSTDIKESNNDVKNQRSSDSGNMKRLKLLKAKLKQIIDIEKKIASGQTVLSDQNEKIKRKVEIEKDILYLENINMETNREN